jgi:hypothetical protein
LWRASLIRQVSRQPLAASDLSSPAAAGVQSESNVEQGRGEAACERELVLPEDAQASGESDRERREAAQGGADLVDG